MRPKFGVTYMINFYIYLRDGIVLLFLGYPDYPRNNKKKRTQEEKQKTPFPPVHLLQKVIEPLLTITKSLSNFLTSLLIIDKFNVRANLS